MGKKISRRKVLKRSAWAAGGVALLTGGYTFGYEPYALEVVRVRMGLAGVDPRWIGRRVVQVSDLHVGRTPQVYLRWAMRRASDLGAEVVVITGDFMSCEGSERIGAVMRVLESLKAPRLGIYACLGNHDYGAGWANRDVADELSGELEERGVRVLRNEVAEVEGLKLVGLEDLWSPAWSGAAARAALEAAGRDGGAGIALCHNPDACDLPIWAGFQGWVLAGHTHGGQCKPPFLPPPLLPVKNRRYVAGQYRIREGLELYINRATGNLRPVRFNCRPEVTVFEVG